MSAIKDITGTITLEDGTTSEFRVTYEGFCQWAAATPRLGETVEAVELITHTLAGEGHLQPTVDVELGQG